MKKKIKQSNCARKTEKAHTELPSSDNEILQISLSTFNKINCKILDSS